MSSKKDEQTEHRPVETKAKKPYTTPHMTIHGTVEKITGDVAGNDTDGFGGSI